MRPLLQCTSSLLLRRHACYRLLKTPRCHPIGKPLSTAASSLESCDDDGIVSIALNNPQRRNALSTTVLSTLLEQLQAAKSDPSTKVVILKSFDDDSLYNGVFSSGHDLKEVTQQKEEDTKAHQRRLEDMFTLCSSVMTELSTFPVPTIAQVDGVATAAGCQLVASCHLAVATATSRFGTPGVNIGLFCSTPAVALVRSVATQKHALEMLLTGELISAQRAYEIGLINRIVDVDVDANNDKESLQKQRALLLHQEVQNLASTIASKSSECIQTGLQTFRQQQDLPLQDAYQVAEARMVEHLLGADSREGIDAFLNKRTPSWPSNLGSGKK